MKGDSGAKKLLNEENKSQIYITEISIFEISKGLFFNKNKFNEFLAFLNSVQIIHTNTLFSVDSARFSSELRKKGVTIDDMDLLIAGMMLNVGINRIATRNKKHFSQIKGLTVISY
jgi:tRNA(fMet)-specific endonuclease VapC